MWVQFDCIFDISFIKANERYMGARVQKVPLRKIASASCKESYRQARRKREEFFEKITQLILSEKESLLT